ncbi:MAG: hypothetical protein KAI74_00150, partial [Kiritimatiellae bacterium]|nr:hypothetical protein [Kiritimatiellia bacterium]
MTLLLNIFKKQPWLICFILLGITFILSCMITTFSGTDTTSPSSLSSIIRGDSRTAISRHFFETADLYFHKGAEHTTTTKLHNDIFQRTKQIVSPSGHFHISHSKMKEIMPWLWLSIKMDPHNIETYLVTSFWLANASKKPELALEVLKEGQLNNPYNYQIQMEKGRIYLKQGNLEQAKHTFDTALLFWSKTADQLNEYENMDRAETLLYRGLLAEHDGDTQQAICLYNEILSHFPNRGGIKSRVVTLEKGETPQVLANSFWGNILKSDIQNKSKCQHESHNNKHEHIHDENCNHDDE